MNFESAEQMLLAECDRQQLGLNGHWAVALWTTVLQRKQLLLNYAIGVVAVSEYFPSGVSLTAAV